MDAKEKIISDAYAKYVWGNNPEQVKAFLISSNMIGEKEAGELLKKFRKNIAGPVRIEGIKTLIKSSLMMLLPFGFYVKCLSPENINFASSLPAKVFILVCVIGVYGIYRFINGLFMILNPESEKPKSIF